MNRNFIFIKRAYGLFPALFLLLFFQLTTAFSQPITVETGRYQVDKSLKLIVCNQMPTFPTGQQLPTLHFDDDYTFTQSVSAFEVGKPYKVKTGSTTYTLYFTNFPLIEIKTQGSQTISNTDDRTKGTFTLANGTDPFFSSNMGIRIRGNISRKFPKKSYNMELWQDPDGNEELETSLLNMRKDSKWYLLAMYNEPLRLNNATSHNIWLNMHKLYYADKEPDANSAIRTRYCDVFLNNTYAGVYLFTEPMDRKQLKLKKTGDNGEIRGELYKADGWSDATTFKSVPPPPTDPAAEVWAEFEMEYPDPYWNNLIDLVSYVVNTPAGEFKETVSKKLKLDNLVDYFIFLNLVNASDNFGNNQFVARYKEGEPYFLIPWDLDGTFGYLTTSNRSEDFRGINSNHLFDRLLELDPAGFKSKMRKRWFALRKNQFALQNIKTGLNANFNQLTAEGAYARETMKWAGTVKTTDMPVINTWFENRIKFLDDYFALFPGETSGIDLSYFQGEVSGEGKNLKWATQHETDAKQFELEFSPDGVTFSKVETIPATGSSQVGQTYSFVHADNSALAFYRLKLVTDDDKFTYSDFIQIGANSCAEAPAAPTISTSLTDITAGQTAVLTATGCSQTVVWSTGQTGFSVVVEPAVTTTYTAKCRQAAGCESQPSASVKINVYPNGSIPGNFEGYLGSLNCDLLIGWAWDRTKPNAPVYVNILDGQQVVSTVLVDDFRQDLKDAGKGNGIHGFTFTIPETLKDNQVHSISTQILGSNFILKGAPKSLTCKGATPPVNQPPVAPAVSPLSATVNAPFTATLPAFTDSDSPMLTYTLTGLPGSLTFTASSRTITGIPTSTATLSLVYTASDGTNSKAVQVALTIVDENATPTNQPPVAPTVSPLSATINAPFIAVLPAFTDPESDALTYRLAGLPGELNFADDTRTITGTPTSTATLSLTYTASDGTNSKAVQILLTITDGTTTPPPSTTVTAKGAFVGYLDKVECGSFRGWIWDNGLPNAALTVEFFANGVSLGIAKADIFRQDLKDAGKGNGNHAYSFPTPAQVKDGKTYQITAYVQNSRYQLNWSPKSLNCPVGSRQATEVVESSGLRVWPNPGSGMFEVSFDHAAAGPSELSVVDELGRTWYRKTVEGVGQHQEQVVLLGANGPYMLVLRQGRHVQSKKLLIRR